jgi:hypothetical protein
MKATITDPQTIDAISPVDLASYLRVRGWHRGPEIAGGLAQTWLWQVHDDPMPCETVDVIVPAYREMRDFRRRVSETLKTLEEIEKRSQLDILTDIQSISSDVIRWRWIEPAAEDGTIPLELATALCTGSQPIAGGGLLCCAAVAVFCIAEACCGSGIPA